MHHHKRPAIRSRLYSEMAARVGSLSVAVTQGRRLREWRS